MSPGMMISAQMIVLRLACTQGSLPKKQSSGDGFAYQYAQIYAQWGDATQAFTWLGVAEKVGDPGLILANGDPLLDPIRQDARFAKLIQRLGLVAA